MGIAVRPATTCRDVGTQDDAEMADSPGDSPGRVGERAARYTSTETLFLRVTQGQQGVLQLHKASR